MGKMKRFAAWMLMMAMLLGSFGIAEEGVIVEAEALPAEVEALNASDLSGELMVVDEYCDHSYGEWRDCGDGYHQFHCFNCGHVDEKEEHYVYDGVNQCSACGLAGVCKHERIFFEILEGGTHWKLCIQCYDYLAEPEKHSYKNGICEYCGLLNECEHEEYIWTSNGDGTHSSYCMNCGEPGGATWDCFAHCSDPTKCRDCGAAYTGGEAPGHTYAGNYVDLGNGKHVMECIYCGEQFKEEAHFIYCYENGKTSCSACGAACSGDSIQHETWNDEEDRENWVYANSYAHGLKCVACNEWVGSGKPHTFEDGYCTLCGSRNTCRHSKISWNRQVEDTGDGVHHSIACNECKEVVKLEEHTMSGGECLYCDAKGPCGHESTTWKDLGDGTHGEVCAYCGEKMSDNVEAHSVKCTSEDKLCSGCGAEVSGDAISHNYIYPYLGTRENWEDLNYGLHALICYDCGEEKPGSREAHTLEEDGGCSKCYYNEYEHDCYDYCDNHSGFCYVCGKETAGVDHRGGKHGKVNEYYHGWYCERCDVYYGLAVHHNYCFHDGYCYEKEGDYCDEKVNSKYVPVQHFYSEATQDSKNPDYHYFSCSQCGETERELHRVKCTEGDTYCADCGAYVEKGKYHEFIKYGYKDIVVMPDNPGKHGRVCECGEIFYPTAHNYMNGFCADCGVEQLGVTDLVVPETMTMGVGETAKQMLVIAGTAEKMEYVSSNTKVATVDAEGVITAKKAGSATITVTATGVDGISLSAATKLTVKKAPTKVALSDKTKTIGVGEVVTLTAKLSPSGAYSAIAWTSSDESVVQVNADGEIYGAGEGSATITAETFNGKKASCKVEVLGAPAELTVDVTELKLNVKKTYTLKAEAKSATGGKCAGTLRYASADTSVATVDAKGKVTAKKAGETTITVSTYNGIVHEVKVSVFAQPKKVTLNVTKETIEKGATLQIVPSVEADAYTTYSYTTSSKKVATVDASGLVTALAEGTATITVKTANGKKATAKITVIDPYKPTGVELAETGTVMLSLGETLQLNASLLPTTAKSELTW
ncbi:MAG: Ig-like domain-containing protein, partial [Clostridia bacterium]|nr:Ig-like domain-containing protein [Clostridia bacterium]